MRALCAILVLLVTLPFTLLAGLVAFLGHLARIGWVLGVDSARWLLDPYPDDSPEPSDLDADRPPVIGSPRSHAEILAEVARKNAAGDAGFGGAPFGGFPVGTPFSLEPLEMPIAPDLPSPTATETEEEAAAGQPAPAPDTSFTPEQGTPGRGKGYVARFPALDIENGEA